MLSSSISTKPERRRLHAVALVLCGLVMWPGLSAADTTGAGTADVTGVAPWRALLPQAVPLGAGDMSFFGLRVYHATLWSASGPFDPAQPFALQLRYYRSISRQRLVSTSISEIRRLSRTPVPAATLARWETLLGAAFVDVNEGDELTGVYQPGRGMRLYDRQRLLAELEDDALALAFFDIWLNPESRDPKLRQRLIGAQP